MLPLWGEPMTCPLFVELCAGTAALSLRLHHPHARPPVSRMGAKTGYADVILRVLGLRPGQGSADRTRYLWCEPDAGVRLLLEALRDKELALAAAAIIRGWRDEDPKALWTRLKDEGPVVAPSVDPREVARWVHLTCQAFRSEEAGTEGWGGCFLYANKRTQTLRYPAEGTAQRVHDLPTLPATITDDARGVDPREVARWSWIAGHEDAHGTNLKPQYDPEYVGPWKPCKPSGWLADRYTGAPSLPATITDDARTIDPREVARYARILTANRLVNPNPETWTNTGRGGYKHGGAEFCTPIESLAEGFSKAVEVPATITDDARTVEPPTLPAGTCCFIDPPYVGTTGYQHDLGRPEVVALARKWAEAGAFVAISEAEPISALVAEGWSTVEITGERKGQKRTFSKQQREWLTLSRAPRWRPSVQGSLFG